MLDTTEAIAAYKTFRDQFPYYTRDWAYWTNKIRDTIEEFVTNQEITIKGGEITAECVRVLVRFPGTEKVRVVADYDVCVKKTTYYPDGSRFETRYTYYDVTADITDEFDLEDIMFRIIRKIISERP